MSSFVIRIARTLSQGSEGLTPRRSASLDEDGVIPQQPVLRRLSMSPSFNDFSLSVQEDAEEEYRSLVIEQLATKSRDVIETRKLEVTQRRAPAAAGSPRNVVHPADATTSATSPRPMKSRSVKVMGMDAYDYCELLRSSSL